MLEIWNPSHHLRSDNLITTSASKNLPDDLRSKFDEKTGVKELIWTPLFSQSYLENSYILLRRPKNSPDVSMKLRSKLI